MKLLRIAMTLSQGWWPIPQAAASVLIEAHTGEIIFGVNEDSALPPASTTKILTALLALDMQADLDKPRLISAEAAAVEESSLYLRAGEILSPIA